MTAGGGMPDVQNQCIMNAITWGADIIYTTSFLASTVQQGIKAAQNAGIPIVSGSNGTDWPNPKIDVAYDFLFDVGPDYVLMGRAMAEWMSANSDGSGEVAVFGSPGAYSLIYFEEGLLAGLDAASNLTYNGVTEFTLDQTSDPVNRMVIDHLTNNPNTEYVFMPFDPAAVSTVEALEVAGFEDVPFVVLTKSSGARRAATE